MTVYIPAKTSSLPQHSNRGSDLHSAEIRKMTLLLGVPIDNLSMVETLDRIENFVAKGRRTGKTHQIATVNTDFLVKSLDDSHLRSLLQNIDMCTADGMPIVWGSKLLGQALRERVAGSDLVPLLAERAAKSGLSMYFMGSAEGIADKAATILRAQHPDLNIVGTSSPYWKPGQEFDPAILQEIKALKPDILLVAFGNPKQEQWIEQYGQATGVPVAIGIGASLDFIAGVTKRAPVWMRQSGLEWIARLVQEPGRLWKRYTLDFTKFVPSIMQQWWLMRTKNTATSNTFQIDVLAIGNTTILNLHGNLCQNRSGKLLNSGQRALARRQFLTINLADVDCIDSVAIGVLMELYKQTEAKGGVMRIVGIGPKLSQVFQMLNMTKFFKIDDASLVYGMQG